MPCMFLFFSVTLYLSDQCYQHVQWFPIIHPIVYDVVKGSHRKSNSLVLRKFKMGAKAVGSRSMKIWITRGIHTVTHNSSFTSSHEELDTVTQSVCKRLRRNTLVVGVDLHKDNS